MPMTSLIAIGLLAVSGQAAPASAPSIFQPSASNGIRSAMGWDSVDETPTMRRQKLKRAMRLKQRIDDLLEADGGSLTPLHQAQVRREARSILYGR